MRSGVLLLLLLGLAHAAPAGSVEGRVTDADGAPVPWAIVTAHCVTTEEPLSRSSRADADGYFTIEKVPPGAYVLDVGEPVKPTEEDAILEKQMPKLRSRFQHALRVIYASDHPHRVSVGPDSRVRCDVRRPRKLPVTVSLEREGQPLAGVSAALLPLTKDERPRLADPFDLAARGATDDRGEIVFPAVPEGRYVLSLEMDGWEFRCRRVEVLGKEPLTIPVLLGRYRARLKVVDARGSPVTSATLWLAEGGTLGVFSRGASKDASGLYTVPCAREGRYVPYVLVGGVIAKGQAIDLGPKSPDPEVTLPLPPTGSLLVRVVDREGAPEREVTVEVEHPSGVPGLSYESDRNGEVRVEHLPPGKWSVRRRGDEVPREVTVKALAAATLALPPLPRGRLVVHVSGADGRPASGEDIYITHASGNPTIHRRTVDGKVEIDLAAGKWTVTSPFMAKHSAEVKESEEATVRMSSPY